MTTRALLLALILLCAANCAPPQTRRPVRAISNQTSTPAAGSATHAPTAANVGGQAASESGREKETPAEFREVDFKNFSYPAILGAEGVRLKDGMYELADRESMGGYTVELQDVDFVDLTSDGRAEAVVRLLGVGCGGSCNGGSHLFYVYTKPQRNLKLFWRIKTGSIAYGCGLKSFAAGKGFITLEAFGDCRLERGTLTGEHELGKFEAKEFTRFEFEVVGGKIVIKQREIFPIPLRDVKIYDPDISISDD
jgi:hypothetical protein